MPRSKSRPSKAKSRPIKSLKERKRRMSINHKKLIELGVPEAELPKMSTKQIRELLKTPVKTKKALAAK